MNGLVCNSNQYCSEGEEISTSDLESGEICCLDGTCKLINGGNQENLCEDNGGICEPNGCGDGYEEDLNYECSISSDICCVQSEGGTTPLPIAKKSKLWVWILLGLIILILVGIAFREKLKMLLIKSKTGKRKDEGHGLFGIGGPRPSSPPGGLRPIPSTQRRIIPSQQPISQRKPITSRSSKELDDVLKKLKDMSS